MRATVKFMEGDYQQNRAAVQGALPEAKIAIENAKRNRLDLIVNGDIDAVRSAIRAVCPSANVWDETVPNFAPDDTEDAPVVEEDPR